MILRPQTATMKLPRQLSPLSLASSPLFTPHRLFGRRPLHLAHHPRIFLHPSPHRLPPTPTRSFTSTSSTSSPDPATADALMEHLTDLYNTARDEFEIAAEETEKKTTYGAEDREAAHEAFQALREAYGEAVAVKDGGVGDEVERRVGPRIRELEAALRGMDEMALED